MSFSKLLFLGLLGVVVYLLMRGARRSRRQDVEPRAPAVQRMVVCAQCGVHLPEDDSLPSGGQHYCCEQHRELGPAPIARKR